MKIYLDVRGCTVVDDMLDLEPCLCRGIITGPGIESSKLVDDIFKLVDMF